MIDHVKPGATLSRKIVVGDNAATPPEVAVYPAAADIKDGQFVPQADRAINELSSWTKVSESSVSLRPGASRTLDTTIAVPADAAPGERYAVVWAEIASAATTGVRQVNRVGVRIYLSVGPGGEPASDFTIDTLTANRLPDGIPVVYALVHNTGGRALDMSGSLGMSNGPGGLNAGPFTAKLGTTLGVKETEPGTVALDKALPAGPWTARVELISGLTRRSAQAVVTSRTSRDQGSR
ncbi:MAG: peptidase [Pseudorhodobacter sp.]|nr:peptidase [Frankiaceae bacterium]